MDFIKKKDEILKSISDVSVFQTLNRNTEKFKNARKSFNKIKKLNFFKYSINFSKPIKRFF